MRKLPGYFKKIAGPAAVMAAASMGAGSASSLILTGAWFRYELLWVVLLILPLLVITVDTASRIGLLNKNKGMFSLICEHIHPGVGWLLLAINIPVHLLISMGQMSVMTSAALSLFEYNPPATAAGFADSNYQVVELIVSLVFAAGIVWLLTSEGYQRMQKYMTAFMLLMCINAIVVPLVYLAVLIMVNKKSVMGEYTSSMPRNIILLAALILSVTLSVIKLPEFVQALLG